MTGEQGAGGPRPLGEIASYHAHIYYDPATTRVEADTDFIGKIVVRYTFEATANGTKYTRTLRNPDRPSEPSPEQIARMDEEALIGLENIKRNVEKRFRSPDRHPH